MANLAAMLPSSISEMPPTAIRPVAPVNGIFLATTIAIVSNLGFKTHGVGAEVVVGIAVLGENVGTV